MTWRTEKTSTGNDYVWDGVEFGIAPSPTKGNANIQNANIATLSGELLASYNRTAQQQEAITNGILTPSGATDFTAPSNLKAGSWIRVSASTVTSISAATNPTTATIDYLIVAGGGGGGNADNSGAAGAGGAGEYVASSVAKAVGSYLVRVGSGGRGGNSFAVRGGNGTDSSIATIDTATGGGGGGIGLSNITPSTNMNGLAGGSGGGGGGGEVGFQGTGGTGSAGNNGGAGFASATTSQRAGGGGGGASSAGAAGASSQGGAGGNGTSNSITGTAVTYSIGGGGGGTTNAGQGGSSNVAQNQGGANAAGGSALAANPGSGGGGASTTDTTGYNGGDGSDGIVVISYTTGSLLAVGGVVTKTATNTVHTFTEDGVFTIVSIPSGGLYYVSYDAAGVVRLSAKYDPTSVNTITHGTTGSITFSVVATPNSMVAKATEKYTTSSSTGYRYYMLDRNGYTWVYDTSATVLATGAEWMLPDPTNYSALNLTGLAILNGWALVVGTASVYGKPTVNLGEFYNQLVGVYLNEPFASHTNFTISSNQGKMYYCDGNYIGEIFPTTSLVTSVANVQSMCSYTAVTTIGTITAIISGSLPYNGSTRVPVQFFTDQYGTLPTAIVYGTVYYIEYSIGGNYFEVYSSLTSLTEIDIATGAVGNQYFNTFFPTVSSMGVNGSAATVQFAQQRLNLPAFETAQTMVEIGNTVIIGGSTNNLYPWNQIDATPSDFIQLPESDTKVMVNVNNMAYVFTGNKGNVYVTNGSVASLALKVPDYCAGVPGTPLTYIEPVFYWGDAAFLRGRVYFSIQDQTATKAGNCGGIWSFIPSQNIDPSQEVGMALRLENQQSYGDYDGVATIILPNQVQTVTSPQYWAAWQNNYSVATSSFGIDYTGTTPVTKYVFETDLLNTGTTLVKQSFLQLEFKLATPLLVGDSVQLYWRLNATDAWTSAGTVAIEDNEKISGYFSVNFQKTQWVQVRGEVTTNGTTASSYGRLKEVRLR